MLFSKSITLPRMEEVCHLDPFYLIDTIASFDCQLNGNR